MCLEKKYPRSGRSNQSVVKWNAREFSELVLARMTLLMDQRYSVFPKRGNLESCGGKICCARLEPFNLNWPEPALFGRPERTNGKRPKPFNNILNVIHALFVGALEPEYDTGNEFASYPRQKYTYHSLEVTKTSSLLIFSSLKNSEKTSPISASFW